MHHQVPAGRLGTRFARWLDLRASCFGVARRDTIGGVLQPSITDADERYLEEIAYDCARVLGPGVEIERLQLETNGDVVLHLRYRLGAIEAASEGRGSNLLAAL